MALQSQRTNFLSLPVLIWFRMSFQRIKHVKKMSSDAVAVVVYQPIGNVITNKTVTTVATKMNMFVVSLLTQSFQNFPKPSFSEQKVCGVDEFTCRSASGECVPLTWMCDDNPDCSDGSDEKACSKLPTPWILQKSPFWNCFRWDL